MQPKKHISSQAAEPTHSACTDVHTSSRGQERRSPYEHSPRRQRPPHRAPAAAGWLPAACPPPSRAHRPARAPAPGCATRPPSEESSARPSLIQTRGPIKRDASWSSGTENGTEMQGGGTFGPERTNDPQFRKPLPHARPRKPPMFNLQGYLLPGYNAVDRNTIRCT